MSSIRLIRNTRFIEKLTIYLLTIILLIYIVLLLNGRFSIYSLFIVVPAYFLAATALSLPFGQHKEVLMFNFPIPLWLLPVIMYVIGQLDIAFHSNTGFAYVLALAVTLTLIVLVRKRPVEKIAMASATVIASFLPLFSLYTPTFGNDTWRDLLWAKEILIQASITGTVIKHSAYPFPILPLTYAIVSLQTGLDPLWTSVLLGVAYLYILPISVYLLSQKITKLNNFSGAFLLLTVPLVVVWSTWYIPQVHALMLYLISMLQPSIVLQIILLLTATLTHGGMALLMSLILFLLWIATSEKRYYVLLLVNIIITIIYIVYTSLLNSTVGGYRAISDAIMAFVLGVKRVTPTVSPPLSLRFTVALSELSLIILGILSFLVFLYKDKNIKILIAGLGSLLVAGYVGIADFDILRYLGLPSLIILSIFIPYVIKIIYSKKGGTLYMVILFLLSIFSFAYAGTFAPRNSYTANPYSYSALSGLLEYNEAIYLHQIIELVTSGVYFIDWRGGAYLMYSNFEDIQPTISGFRYKDVEFVVGGNIGGVWGYDIKKLISYNCSSKWLLIIRHRIYENYYYFNLLTSIHLCNDISIVLDSNIIKIYKT
jgi:hypothetical protein